MSSDLTSVPVAQTAPHSHTPNVPKDAPQSGDASLNFGNLSAVPKGSRAGVWLACGLAALALVSASVLWSRVNHMQRQLARQAAQVATQSIEASTLARQAEQVVRDTAAKVAVLENRLSEISAYRLQLEDLVHKVSRVRDENLAVELEATVRAAQEQTQLTGSVEPLLAALHTAQRRLNANIDPRMQLVKHAVERDLERVTATTVPDIAGLLARIDQLLRQVDRLPMANQVGQSDLRKSTDQLQKVSAKGASVQKTSWWVHWWQSVQTEASHLLRISRIERPEAMMLSPEQAFFVRENFKLYLQGAKLGLLAKQYEAARNNLQNAQTELGQWFDPAAVVTQKAATQLQHIQGLARSAQLPRAQETLTALASAVTSTSDPDNNR